MSSYNKTAKSDSDMDSMVLKIETQRSSENNPYQGMQDQRELMKYQSNNQQKKVANSEFNRYLFSIIVVVVLNTVYYAMITKSRRGILITKVYNSFCLLCLLFIDKLFNYEFDNIYIVDEQFDNELKQDLIEKETKEIQMLDEKYLNNGGSSFLVKAKSPVVGLDKFSIIFLMISLGLISFFNELITYCFIQKNDEFNLGVPFCILSYEFIIIKLYNHIKLGQSLKLTNILGLIAIYFLAISYTLIFYDQENMYYSLVISILRFSKYYIQLKLKFQINFVILLISGIADVILGLFFMFYLLYGNEFYILSLSHFIILFFASSCYYFYMKNYRIFDLSIYAFSFPVLGIIDLVINDRKLDYISLLCMLLMSGAVILTFSTSENERNMFSSKKDKKTQGQN